MDKLLELLRRSRVVPILWAGGVGFIFQLGVFELAAVYWQLLSPSVATVLGAEGGILINFFINDRVSFAHCTHKVPLPERLLRHQGVVLVAIFLQWLFVYLAEQVTTDLLVLHLALFGGIGLGFIWNYMWYHLFVWQHSPPEL